jgi:hypothetical protein
MLFYEILAGVTLPNNVLTAKKPSSWPRTFNPRPLRLICSPESQVFVRAGYSNPTPKRLD